MSEDTPLTEHEAESIGIIVDAFGTHWDAPTPRDYIVNVLRGTDRNAVSAGAWADRIISALERAGFRISDFR